MDFFYFSNISCPFAQKAHLSSQRMDQARLLYLNELRPLDYGLYVTEGHVILKFYDIFFRYFFTFRFLARV